jgi:hypothetical protein
MKQAEKEGKGVADLNTGLGLRRREQGQSLVEMALVAPILILMFIGVVEVGWALRGYLTLLNASREAARFVARGRYVDFSDEASTLFGYSLVLSQTQLSLAEQLPIQFTGPEPNATLILSHYFIKTIPPCDNPPCNDNDPATCPSPPCDSCSDPNKREAKIDQSLWQILHPEDGTHNYYRATYGVAATSRISPTTLVPDLLEENLRFNCELISQDPVAVYSSNSVIVVEIIYEQPQLLGVPVISNQFTDPVPLYVHTIMRITADTRASGEG